MILTFFLFRVGSGDIAAANLGEKASEKTKAAWRHVHGYDLPLFLNIHRNLLVVDKTGGRGQFRADDAQGCEAAEALSLILAASEEGEEDSNKKPNTLMGRYALGLSLDTPVREILAPRLGLVAKPRPTGPPPSAPEPAPAPPAASNPAMAPEPNSATSGTPAGRPATASAPASAPAAETAQPETPTSPPLPPGPLIVFTLSDGRKVPVSVEGIRTVGDLIERINGSPANGGKLEARVSGFPWGQLFRSQFFRHLRACVFFESRSLQDNKTLSEVIARHAPYSLAVQIPALAIEWMLGLAISCFVAYYRGTLIDRIGVFLCVLGMCIPFLAFMIFGQSLMFALGFPQYAFGLMYRGNVFVPVAIIVIAGLGGNVRFYRTVILDETGRDYVRTARAKGLPLPTILFKHVLRNCMLPILTSLILSIPFLIMGGLLVETYFGINGLGDLMLTSINNRNEPIMNALVYLTALIYTVGILLTDISYAIFDPRIRLR